MLIRLSLVSCFFAAALILVPATIGVRLQRLIRVREAFCLTAAMSFFRALMLKSLVPRNYARLLRSSIASALLTFMAFAIATAPSYPIIFDAI